MIELRRVLAAEIVTFLKIILYAFHSFWMVTKLKDPLGQQGFLFCRLPRGACRSLFIHLLSAVAFIHGGEGEGGQ